MNRADYDREVAARWSDWCLRDARSNFALFEEHREELAGLVSAYLHDNWQKDLHGKCHNPEGTLSGMCWHWAPGNEVNFLLLDFNEPSQTFFLRRGLIAYLKLLIRDREQAHASEPTLPLPLG